MLVNIQYLDKNDEYVTLISMGLNHIPMVGDIFKSELPNGKVADLVVKRRVFKHGPGDTHVDLLCDIIFVEDKPNDIGI
jgi:hypothetical protein